MPSRSDHAGVRQWAQDNGFEVGDRGVMGAGIYAAYDAAHAGDGPDWDAGAAALGIVPGADPLASDDNLEPDAGELEPDPTGAQNADTTASDGATTSPRPVASLAEARARAGGAPKRPPWAGKPKPERTSGGRSAPRSGNRKAAGKQADIEVTPEVVADIEGKMALLLAFPVSGWAYLDPWCGGAMEDALPDVVPKLVPLLCQSQAVVRLLTGADTWIALVGLLVALKPVTIAIYEHHISPNAATRQHAEREASAARRGQPPGEQQAPAGPDLSAYTSSPVVTGHVPAYRPA